MSLVYLVRHAMPNIPLGERWCLGRTDLPLGDIGRMQAALLPYVPELLGKPVFCSYLRRAVETARALCPEPMIRDGLEEQDMGIWDGLSFTEIMMLYPELYAAREQNPGLMPDSAEPMSAVRARMIPAVKGCVEEAGGDIVIVSHKSAIDSLTGQRPKLDHTSISVLDWHGDSYEILDVGRMPHPQLTEEICLRLLEAAGTPAPVIDHCRAVAKESMRLADQAADRVFLDRELLLAAALLHDVVRDLPDHAACAARGIKALGYPDVAEVIAQHHDLPSAELNEAAVLYLADKYIQGTERVTLEQRFGASEGKCLTDEARAAHAQRFETAKQIENILFGS